MVNYMNCHGKHNNNNGEGDKHKGPFSHMLMMALCCGAPIIILLLLPVLTKIGGNGLAKVLTVIAPLICPLMMVGMVSMMFKRKKEDKDDCCQNKHEGNQVRLNEKIQE